MDVRLTQTQPQQQFRLLELPSELLELLESENPPEYVQTGLSLLSRTQADRHRLSLKSSTPSTSPSTSTSDFVNLCTPTKTFSLRQVNSSNSILLIKPQGEENITSIAQCKSTLEVQAMDANTSTNSALLPLLAALPIYDESDIRIDERTEDDDHPLSVAEIMQERLKVFADIPFSVVECERAWTDICAFVYKNKESGAIGCHRPSARAKLMAWEKMVEGATLHGIDLGRQFLVDDLWSAVIEEAEHTVIDEYPFPRSLFDAIVRRLVDDSPDIDRVLKWANFDQNKTASWTGEVILEASTSTPTAILNLETYTSDWKDLLPEQWRADARIDNLKNANMKLPAAEILLSPARVDDYLFPAKS
ncbi:hypothetical protein McanCB56680_007770 [Microsporum canis]|uniref:Sister chromatid cohesion protein Dcc1 n=1 Tax=Arthroderma otae (strain ATCC MYA-4605 / CBS 113480) TaxID=554155 RepID=C5FZ54_ARTOC|nr:conserved hypothetical protein [Microsporum canis CBS 113480]EEQ35157.1 conserved hypothetical protein [Microsporum canis CBS 113480]